MILGLDIGSSSIKAAVLRGDRPVGPVTRIGYKTKFQDAQVEIEPPEILHAIRKAVAELGPAKRRVDAIALSVMSPAWVAMDKLGRPITPIVTHQDRRSILEATEIESRIGKSKHLSIAGVRPVPGGISSTTWAWFNKHHRSTMKRADLVGHLNTFLIRQWTGQRIIDPSNASFTGLFSTRTQSGWSDDLCSNVSMPRRLLPEIIESNQIAGKLSISAARTLGLPDGLLVLAGIIDTSAAILLSSARVGQLLNSCGSTDVLALLTNRFHPNEHLITRAFGIGKQWMSVSTIAAAGSAMVWAHNQLFPDHTWPRFNRVINQLARDNKPSAVQFSPHLAGDRMNIEQPSAAFTGLTMATTRREMLRAIIDSLAAASAARLPLLSSGGIKPLRKVLVSGHAFDRILRRDWPGRWQFIRETDASLRGLSRLWPN